MSPTSSGHPDHVGALAAEVAETLRDLGDVSWRKMFGGAGLYLGGAMFALVDPDAQLHLKVDDTNRARFEAAGSERFRRMPYYAVPAEVLDDPALLLEWAAESAAVARR
jgi:DNA transformation protein